VLFLPLFSATLSCLREAESNVPVFVLSCIERFRSLAIIGAPLKQSLINALVDQIDQPYKIRISKDILGVPAIDADSIVLVLSQHETLK
jgi:hypothetical protein